MVVEFVSSHLSRVAVCVPRSGYEMSWAAESSSSAARTSLRIAHSLLQAQRSNRRQPRGDPFSASLRALMGEGVAFY